LGIALVGRPEGDSLGGAAQDRGRSFRYGLESTAKPGRVAAWSTTRWTRPERAALRVLLIDDHPLVQDAVGNVLRGLDPAVDIAVAGECNAGLEIAARGAELDLLLLDLNLPGLSGIPALKRWRSQYPSVPVVVLSALDDSATVLAAINGGAAGYIPKSSSNQVMREALRLVLAGGKYLPPELLARPAGTGRSSNSQRQAIKDADSLGLTDRQIAVLRLIVKGAPNKVICRELGLAERTVKAHVTAVLRSLKVSSRTQAAVEAVRLGLADAGR
jgi:DNA-binding NarL/FixJ family response regulator